MATVCDMDGMMRQKKAITKRMNQSQNREEKLEIKNEIMVLDQILFRLLDAIHHKNQCEDVINILKYVPDQSWNYHLDAFVHMKKHEMMQCEQCIEEYCEFFNSKATCILRQWI